MVRDAERLALEFSDLVNKSPAWPREVVVDGFLALNRGDFAAFDAVLARLEALPPR